MGRLEVEHQVELADVAKVAVERLDERVDELERREAVFARVVVVATAAAAVLVLTARASARAAALVDSDEEEERGVAAVDDADAAVVDEGALKGRKREFLRERVEEVERVLLDQCLEEKGASVSIA